MAPACNDPRSLKTCCVPQELSLLCWRIIRFPLLHFKRPAVVAPGEDVASEREVRVRKASFLHKIAEQARFHCAEAGESDEVFAEGQPLSSCMIKTRVQEDLCSTRLKEHSSELVQICSVLIQCFAQDPVLLLVGSMSNAVRQAPASRHPWYH
jgi:hypothetical protein